MDIQDPRVLRALSFLHQTDEQSAALKGEMLRTEYMAKLKEAFAFKTATGSSVEERKNNAKTEQSVQDAWNAHFDAVIKFEAMRAKREHEDRIWETWRSVSANRRQGQV